MDMVNLLARIEKGLDQLDKLEHLQDRKARSDARDALRTLRLRVLDLATSAEATSAVSMLKDLGYTFHGVFGWRPPLGMTPNEKLTKLELQPDAVRWGFDGYGWNMMDNGSGSNWMERHPDAEPMYSRSTVLDALIGVRLTLPRQPAGQIAGFTVVIDPELPPGTVRFEEAKK